MFVSYSITTTVQICINSDKPLHLQVFSKTILSRKFLDFKQSLLTMNFERFPIAGKLANNDIVILDI